MEDWRAAHVPGQTLENYEAMRGAEQEAQGLVYAVVVAIECVEAAKEAETTMQVDPGQNGLEDAYRLLLDELSNLATIFSMGESSPSESEDGRAGYAAKHTEVSATIDRLIRASMGAKPTWDFLRGVSDASGRARYTAQTQY